MPIHADEVRANVGQVRRLLAAQCPQWADLPVTSLPDELEGTDHVLFRVGRFFWLPGQEELVAPYAEKYLESLGPFGETGMLWAMTVFRSNKPMAEFTANEDAQTAPKVKF